ncbi:hypothetical protein B0A48_16999 [Cryoendolithus antarcticus]|uniref:Extracellular membrane protein CFEM domain-containing protein n=1 Tax=Cryoendolithus antarcticus TaxID=1507870 RepID=A0A1V8SBY5_9PEZI|nr:hypothetical protein B0A48_16999 [Cryoendolithus antarcticus]
MAPLISALRVLLAADTIGLVVVNAHTLCAFNCYAEIASDNGCVGRDPNSTRINLDCFCKLPMTVAVPQCDMACRPHGNWDENDNDICGPLQPVGEIATRATEDSIAEAVAVDAAPVDTRDARKVSKADKQVCDQRCYHSLKRAKECNSHLCTINDLTINRDVPDTTEHMAPPPLTLCGWTGISCAVAANGDADVIESTYDDTEEVPLLPLSTAAVDKRDVKAKATDTAVEHADSGIDGLNNSNADLDVLPRSLPPPTLCGYHGMSCASVVNRDAVASIPTTFETVYKSDVLDVLPRSIRPPTLCGFFGISCKDVVDSDIEAPVPTSLEAAFNNKNVPFTPAITVAPGSTASRMFTLQGPPPLVTASPITTAY